MQLRGDLGERAVRIGGELRKAAFAPAHMRAQRPDKAVSLFDEAAQLGFGHRLIREDFAQPFEKCEIRCLSQGA